MKTPNNLQEKLFSMQDVGYKEFHAPLIPTVNPNKVIGVRTPRLRLFAKEFNFSKEKQNFLRDLPHYYYEENNLHAFLIEKINDYHECTNALDTFFPFIDNWATCDMMNPKVLLKNRDLLKEDIKRWLNSSYLYAVRFAIVCAMRAFCEENYSDEIACLIAKIESSEYYVNCAIGWYFATLLTKNYKEGIKFLEKKKLNAITHNLAIKKAIESKQISNDKKDYLKTLKIH